jgi:hypothetical protein
VRIHIAGRDATRARPGHERRHGQAQLVDQVLFAQLAKQIRPALAQEVHQAHLAQLP